MDVFIGCPNGCNEPKNDPTQSWGCCCLYNSKLFQSIDENPPILSAENDLPDEVKVYYYTSDQPNDCLAYTTEPTIVSKTYSTSPGYPAAWGYNLSFINNIYGQYQPNDPYRLFEKRWNETGEVYGGRGFNGGLCPYTILTDWCVGNNDPSFGPSSTVDIRITDNFDDKYLVSFGGDFVEVSRQSSCYWEGEFIFNDNQCPNLKKKIKLQWGGDWNPYGWSVQTLRDNSYGSKETRGAKTGFQNTPVGEYLDPSSGYTSVVKKIDS
jgi:hypothetical protein